MAKTRVKVTHEGVTETPVEDGQTFMPEGVGVAAEDLGSGLDASYEVEDATDEIIAELLGDNTSENIEPVEVLVGDRVLRFGIRQLSPRDASALTRKRMRTEKGGRLVPHADADLILRINALASCVCKNTGTKDEPVWVPAWTFEQVAGKGDKKGIIDNATAAGNELVTGLLEEIWLRNATIRPDFLEVREKAIEVATMNGLSA